MKYLTLIPVLLIALTVGLLTSPPASQAEDAATLRPVFVNLTSGENDTQKASMALVLVDNSLKSGREVTLYLNVHGVRLAAADCELAMYNRETLFRDYITELIDAGLAVIACPYCMEKNNLSADDLLDGISVAADENFFPPLDAGAAVFSY